MSRKGSRDVCEVQFHGIIAATLTAGVQQLLLNPSVLSGVGMSRLGTVADTYAHYRVKQLAFRLMPGAARSNDMAAGYVGGVQDTPPSTNAQVMELLPACYLGLSQTVPTEWVRVPKADLAGPLPWYKSLTGGADATEEQPGAIFVTAVAATDPFDLEIRATYEFKTAVAPANTPAAVAARRTIREERIALERKRESGAVLGLIAKAAVGTPTALSRNS